MNNDIATTEALENVMIGRLRESGYKITPQRRIIIHEMIEQAEYHIHAKSIYQSIRDKDPSIGMATVFRTVKIIEELGLFNDIYDSLIKKKHKSNSLMCMICGKIEYINDNLPYEISDQLYKDYSFEASEVNLIVFGKCKKCRGR